MTGQIQIPVISHEQLVSEILNMIPDNQRGFEILRALYPGFAEETLKAAAKEAAIRAGVPSHFE